MINWKIDGYNFKLSDSDLEVNINIDSKNGLMELLLIGNEGYINRMHISREVATVLAFWLKNRLV